MSLPEKNLHYYGDNLDILRRQVETASIDFGLDLPNKADQNNIRFAEHHGSRAADPAWLLTNKIEHPKCLAHR